jgi:hypothetical protein
MDILLCGVHAFVIGSGRNLVEFEKVDVEDGGGEVVVAGNE